MTACGERPRLLSRRLRLSAPLRAKPFCRPRFRAIFPNMAKLSPIESEFESTEAAEAYDAWFRAKIEPRLASNTPGIPHDEAMARVQAILDRRKAR